jgi:hypothetical protein
MAQEEDLVDKRAWKNDGPESVADSVPFPDKGIGGNSMLEPLPKRINTTGEKIVNRGNSWFILGRDRTGSRASGYGGAGATQASSIDICVGMGNGSNPGPATAEFVDPNFKSDSARIYITQRTNIDEAFRLGAQGSQSDIGDTENQSGIGMKADSIRIVGTNGIKLITRPQNKDSRDGTASFTGIELIACNDQKELQYMVKGQNLVEALSELEDRVAALSGILLTFLSAQLQVNTALASHTHQIAGASPAGPVSGVAFPSPRLAGKAVSTIMDEVEAVMDVFKERINLNINWHQRYLGGASSKYILSKYNKVN